MRALVSDDVFRDFEAVLAESAGLFPQGRIPSPNTLQRDDESPVDMTRQKDIDEVLWEQRYQDLLEGCGSAVERACMLASREPLGSARMRAIPHPSLGTCLDDQTVTTAVGLRLHEPVCIPHPCIKCHERLSSHGHHALHCISSKGRSFRHSMINREVAMTLNSVLIPTLREPPGTHLDPFLRPDGISLVPWERGKFLAWDVTVADTLAPSYQGVTSLRAGAAAAKLEGHKKSKYRDLLPQYIFIPVGLETLGPMGPSAKSFFSSLSLRMTEAKRDPRDFDHLLQRVSLIIMRSNTMCGIGTMQ